MIKSPCLKSCKLDSNDKICIGCKRTIEEIKKWSSLSDKDRSKILMNLKNRMAIKNDDIAF